MMKFYFSTRNKENNLFAKNLTGKCQNFTRPTSTPSPFDAHYCVYRPITSLGHQGGEEFSERRTNVLNYVE